VKDVRQVGYYWEFLLVDLSDAVNWGDFHIFAEGPQIRYGAKGGQVPRNRAFLAPDAARDFIQLQKDTGGDLVFWDVYRSVDRQVLLRKTMPNVANLPGFSAHNFGVALDVSLPSLLDWLRKKGKIATTDGGIRRPDLGWAGPLNELYSIRQFLASYGFSPINHEAWHFEHRLSYTTFRGYVADVYKQELDLSTTEIKMGLHELGYDVWPIDEDRNGKYALAVMAMQKDHGLVVDGVPGPITKRVLALLCADVRLVYA